MANKTALKPYPIDIYKITDRLTALAERYGTVANAVWAGIDTTDEAGDADTAGILTGFSRALENLYGFLKPTSRRGLKPVLIAAPADRARLFERFPGKCQAGYFFKDRLCNFGPG